VVLDQFFVYQVSLQPPIYDIAQLTHYTMSVFQRALPLALAIFSGVVGGKMKRFRFPLGKRLTGEEGIYTFKPMFDPAEKARLDVLQRCVLSKQLRCLCFNNLTKILQSQSRDTRVFACGSTQGNSTTNLR
jgi:hypothetical protein